MLSVRIVRNVTILEDLNRRLHARWLGAYERALWDEHILEKRPTVRANAWLFNLVGEKVDAIDYYNAKRTKCSVFHEHSRI